MIDIAMIKNRIDRIEDDLLHLKDFVGLTFDDVARNYNTHKIVERIMEVIVNAAIDINQHIIANSKKSDLPFDFTESFVLLSDIGVYPRDFAEKISKSAGLRNILVHEYIKLNEKKFYNSIKDCYKDYTRYCRYIMDYLKKTK